MHPIVEEIKHIVETKLRPEADPVTQKALVWELLALRIQMSPELRQQLTSVKPESQVSDIKGDMQ